MRSVLLACGLGGSLGAAACLLTLDHEIACGDGFTDTRAGEECDPAEPGSFGRSACGGQAGGCNPLTCTLECCGDGQRQGDEECDGNDLGLVVVGGDPTESNSCRNLSLPGTSVHYSSGSARCTDQCRYDRSDCSLCGNGQLDREFQNPDGTVLPPEVCDGDRYDREQVWSKCASACDLPSSAEIECNVECNGCRLVVPVEPLACCVPEGSPVDDGEPYSCCCLLDDRGCELTVTPSDEDPACPGVRED